MAGSVVAPGQRITPRRRAQYRHAISIAVEYFNYGGYGERIGRISEKAGKWARDYFADSMSRSHGFNADSDLVKAYPDLLNASVSPHLRLRRTRNPPKPLDIPAKPLQRVQEEEIISVTSPVNSTNPDVTEPFPAYTEPLLASEEEMDEIVEMRVRQPANKPVMRVTPADLRGSGLLDHLPEFMTQLAHAKLSRQERTSEAGDTVHVASDHAGFELDEDQARDTVHVEMDIIAGVLEEKGQDTDGESEEDEESDLELAIPSAGTLPSAAATKTSHHAASAARLIRPVSSGSETSSSSLSSSSKKIRLNVNKVTKAKKTSSRPPTPRTASGAKAKERPINKDDSDEDTSSAASSQSSSPSSSPNVDGASSRSSSRRRRVIIHTPASRERSRQRSAEQEEERRRAGSTIVAAGPEPKDAASATRRGAASTSPVRRIILRTSPSSSSTSSFSTTDERQPRKRSRSSSVQSVSRPDAADRPETKKPRQLIEEVD